MANNHSRVLLFDLGGVLIENKMFTELKRLMNSELSEAQIIETWLSNPVARQFELGQCSPAEFAISIVKEFGLGIEPEEFLIAFKDWPRGLSSGAELLLSDLKRKARVCCLSNSNEVHWTEEITRHFDHAFSSHLIGCIKPDLDAFQYVLGAIGVEASNVDFFDDAQLNVEAARSVGINAHHTVGFAELEAALQDLF